MKLTKTVVGSFPPREIPVEDAIRQVADLQLKYDIDIVSDGEQRSDMLGYFESFPGLDKNRRGLYIQSRILPIRDPRDFIKLKDLTFLRNYLKSRNRDDMSVKVTVTGPITLGFFTAINGLNYYSSIRDHDLYSDFADALNPLILEVAKTNCYVQIDEPSLTSRVIDSTDAVKIINESIRDFPNSLYEKGRLILHACGPLNEYLFKDLLNLDVSVLSLAFSSPAVQRNSEIISKKLLREGEKKVGIGCISVQAATKDDVESKEIVIKRLRTIEEKIGEELIAFIHPDCGLRSTNAEAVELILERINPVSRSFDK